MVGIEVKFFNGFHGSSSPNHDSPEWPPSPDRHYQAMVASYYAMRGIEDATDKEREALEWLETQPLPDIIYPDGHFGRTDVYVPTHVLKKPYPDRQKRAMLTFQPRYPAIYYVWPDATINEHWGSIGKILKYYSSLGAAKSFADARLVLDLPELPDCYTRITPNEDGKFSLPVYYSGRLSDLDWKYEGGMMVKKPRARYEEAVPPSKTHPGLFKNFHVFQTEGPFFPSIRAAEFASEVRLSLLKAMSDAGHELACIVGKDKHRNNHLAYIPLIYAGSRFSDGSIQGFGIGVPHEIDLQEEMLLGKLLNRLQKITVRNADCLVSRVQKTSLTLSTSRWSQPSTTWATVTPMELNWANGNGDQKDQIRRFCQWAGLPFPSLIEMSPSPWMRGSEIARKFVSPNGYKGRQQGFLAHVRLQFDVPVRGPVVLGRGGNFGVGIFSQVWPERRVG